MKTNDLQRRVPAHVSLAGAQSVADMAAAEGFWSPESYALVLSSKIRNSGVGLGAQTERLAALAGIGGSLSLQADQASAAVLCQHLAVCEALHQRFAHDAFVALNTGGSKAPEIAERYLSSSLKAQRACLAILSALKVLRSTAPTAPPTTGKPGIETLTLASSN